MLKKNSLQKGLNEINLIIGRNSYTDYNNNYNGNSLKDNFNSINNNTNQNNNSKKIIHSLFESQYPQNKNSINYDLNYPLGLSYQNQAYTQPQFYPSHKLNKTNSTEFSQKRIKNTKLILTRLRKTISKIKNKNKKTIIDFNEDLPQNDDIKKNFSQQKKFKTRYSKSYEYLHNFSKTATNKFDINRNLNKFIFDEDSKNRNKRKELRFKVHNIIKSNNKHLCNNYINKAHLFNEKILEYYQSEHYINLIKNFQNNFHYKLNLENHPKIKMYTDIKSLKKNTKTNKLDFRKCFSEKEQKLILLDPAYYFQNDSPNSFINLNIKRTKKLADRLQEEEEEQQIKQILNKYLNKKNKLKTRNIKLDFEYNESDNEEKRKEKKLISKINKILSQNNIKNLKKLNSKKIETLDITNMNMNPIKNNKELNTMKNDDTYDFFKVYNSNLKNSYTNALRLNKIEKENKNKKKNCSISINKNLRNCIIKLCSLSKDKDLEKRAKENLYYDKSKDEKNKFHIVTKQMLIDQNYEYLSKFGRRQINKYGKSDFIENNKNIDNKINIEKNNKENKVNKENKENMEENKNIYNKKVNNKNKEMSDNKEKKLLNLQINKIKLIYKQQ